MQRGAVCPRPLVLACVAVPEPTHSVVPERTATRVLAGKPALLVVVLDACPESWAEAQSQASAGAALGTGRRVTYAEAIEAAMAYMNAFLMLNRQNQVAVVASLPDAGCVHRHHTPRCKVRVRCSHRHPPRWCCGLWQAVCALHCQLPCSWRARCVRTSCHRPGVPDEGCGCRR